jgi:flagellar protein FliL
MSEATPTDAPKKGSKKLLVVALAAVLLAGGAGGGWWFLHKSAGDGDEVEETAAKSKQHAKPLFSSLEPFTVNLKDPRGERFAQIGVTLQFTEPHVESDIRDHLPAIRNEVLMLISSKQIEELLTTDGKHQLAEEIRTRVARAMGVDLPADDEVAPEAKPEVKAKAGDSDDEDEPEEKPKKKRHKKKKPAVQNPVEQVLFSQFIVQ